MNTTERNKIRNRKNQCDCKARPAEALIRLSECVSDERSHHRAHYTNGKESFLTHHPNAEGAVDDIHKRQYKSVNFIKKNIEITI
jgi:hypothetical protein